MGFRFFRRKKILPGVTLNLSKGGVSVSLGVRGAKYTISKSGTRKTLGLPGTGLFYTKFKSYNSKHSNYVKEKQVISNKSKLNVGFFKKIFISEEEKLFIEGLKLFVSGEEKRALKYFEQNTRLADAAFLSGCLNFKYGDFKKSEKILLYVEKNISELGSIFKKYEIKPDFLIPITDEFDVVIEPEINGIRLVLVEIFEKQNNYNKAFEYINLLLKENPDDCVIKLSFIQLISDYKKQDKKLAEKIINLTNKIENLSPIHATLLLYRAKAFITLNMFTAARDCLTKALRKKKELSENLFIALKYQRGLVYYNLNRKSQSRKDLEEVYSLNQNYKNIKKLLDF
ncbi:MAG: DUF4236 domain-containing protein [Candidatus Muiribacteriota bacterium]